MKLRLLIAILASTLASACLAQPEPDRIDAGSLTPEQKEVIRQWANAPEGSEVVVTRKSRTEKREGEEVDRSRSTGTSAGISTSADKVAQEFRSTEPKASLGQRSGGASGGDFESSVRASMNSSLFGNPFIWVAILLGLGAGFLAYTGQVRAALYAAVSAAAFFIAAIVPVWVGIAVGAIVVVGGVLYYKSEKESERHARTSSIFAAQGEKTYEGLRATLGAFDQVKKDIHNNAFPIKDGNTFRGTELIAVLESYLNDQMDGDDLSTISAARKADNLAN